MDRRRQRIVSPGPHGDWRRQQRHLRQCRVGLGDHHQKFRIGRLPGVAPIAADLAGVLDAQGFVPLPITFAHGQAAGALPGPLKDPFDRMLIAQAMLDGMVLVSNEAGFGAYGVRRIW